jgi:hypothetical protein
MDAYVWHKKLWEAMPVRIVKTGDHEIEQIRNLDSVDLDEDRSRRGYSTEHRVAAPQADVDRWRAATEAIVSAHKSVETRAIEAYHRHGPPRAVGPRMVWQVRYLFGKGKLRRKYENTIAAVEAEILDAYRAYRDAAADLTEHIETERQREKRERRAKEQRERVERAAAMREAVDGAVWACQVDEDRSRRTLEIWLPAIGERDVVAHDDPQLGLTARQVQEAIDRERELDEYIWIEWGFQTGKAMTEWYAAHDHDAADVDDRYAKDEELAEDEELAWQALTGVLVDAVKLRPEELRDSRTRGYGPSSNYWSPSVDTFGTSF